MPIKSQMSSNIGQIESEHLELFALEFGKIAESDFVYIPAYRNIDRSVPNLATIHMPMRAWMSSIMAHIEPEHPELFALEFGNIAKSDCLHSSIYKYQPISTKLGPNIYDHKISDEFDYGSTRTRTVCVICP